MPTKPHKKKSRLEEAVIASTWQPKTLSRRRVATAGMFGCLFGFTGIHNFLMRQKKRGFLHLITSILAFSLFLVPLVFVMSVVVACNHPEKFQCINIREYDDTLNVVMIIGMVLSAAAILWGLIEGVIILINARRFPDK